MSAADISDAGGAASFLEPPSNSDDNDIDSLPSEPDTDDVTVSDDYPDSDAEREWQESLQQLELLLSMVIVPYVGKYFGRKFAYWGSSIPTRASTFPSRRADHCTGWKQFMEWHYPVEIVVTNKAAFKGVGAIEAAASL